MSDLEAAFATRWRQLDGPPLEREYRFAAHHVGFGPGIRKRLRKAGLRDWRFDFAHPGARVAIEMDGGTWTRGRHVRGKGYANDCAKLNAAAFLGWRVWRLTSDMLAEDPVGHLEPILEVCDV